MTLYANILKINLVGPELSDTEETLIINFTSKLPEKQLAKMCEDYIDRLAEKLEDLASDDFKYTIETPEKLQSFEDSVANECPHITFEYDELKFFRAPLFKFLEEESYEEGFERLSGISVERITHYNPDELTNGNGDYLDV